MFFSQISQFPEVDNGRIEIIPFLDASKGIVRFVELLGTVFAPVKIDIMGNIEKLHKIHLTDQDRISTLNDIIDLELQEGIDKIGIDALLWLKRALEYVNVFLTCLVDNSKQNSCDDNLSPFFNKAYEEKLKPYHGWFVQKLFGLIVLAAPSRKSLLQLLAGETKSATEEEIIADVETYLLGLGRNLEVINDVYQANNLDFKNKV